MHFINFVVFTMCILNVSGDSGKSSLTFVIDDTGSMSEDINNVKEGVNAIFDTVMSSNESQIENFILVTFNDYDVSGNLSLRGHNTALRTITKDRSTFKSALSSIDVDGGEDCPEYAMAGIKHGIEVSLPGSNIYVFTDASAKDYYNLEEVNSLAAKKQCQVDFILTGICETKADPAYKAYVELARRRSGQIFHLEKDEIGEILKYVRTSIASRRTRLIKIEFPPGRGNKFNYTTDAKTKDPVVAVTGENPSIDVTGLDGKKIPTKISVHTKHILIAAINESKPGYNTNVVEVGSDSDTTVVVTAKSEVQFAIGFSTYSPSSIKDTTTRPLPDVKSHLAIKLTEGDIQLQTAQIRKLDETILQVINLVITNKRDKFYVTNTFIPPKNTFVVAIIGYDPESKSKIVRKSQPIECQDLATEAKTDRAPVVQIDGGANITSAYGASLQLKCKVNGYPQPAVVWTNKDTGHILPGEMLTIELPNDFVNILNLKDIAANATYHCNASNPSGSDSAEVRVEVPIYFNILEKPTDTVIEYKTDGQINCIINASPPVKIDWFKNGKQLTSDDNIELNENKSILKIKSMKPSNIGTYMCAATSEITRKLYKATVKISGAERPVIDKRVSNFYAILTEHKEIQCKLLKGKPRPSIEWSVKRSTSDGFATMDEWRDKESVIMPNVQKNDGGTYACRATNDFGSDYFAFNVNVQVPVTINPVTGRNISIIVGKELTLPCQAEGYPEPILQWTHRALDSATPSTKIIEVTDKSLLKIDRIQLQDGGLYICTASNSAGSAKITYEVHVLAPPVIENKYLQKVFEAVVGDPFFRIDCEASGNPKPVITWYINGLPIALGDVYLMDKGTLFIRNIQKDLAGEYMCQTDNYLGSDQEIYELTVNDYPHHHEPVINMFVAEGDSANIECSVPHKDTDELRWYKNHVFLTRRELRLINSSVMDTGLYVCRVSDRTRSITGKTINLKVARKPRFTTDEDLYVEFTEEMMYLSCEAEGDPQPEASWTHNGEVISTEEISYYVNINDHGLGEYVCNVSNNFGYITRKFQVTARDCVINVGKKLPRQPVMLSSSLSWPNFHVNDGYMSVLREEYFILICPKQFELFPTSHVIAFCDGGSKIKVNGVSYEYTDLQCTEEFENVAQRTGEQCFSTNSERVKFSYKIFEKSVEVYEVCMDTVKNIPIYSKHIMHSSFADQDYDSNWLDGENFSTDFDQLYDCGLQINVISSLLRKWFHYEDGCCFTRRHLVNPRDLSLGIPQGNANSYYNVVPQWSTCNAENWDDVEQRVRLLAKSSLKPLLVWTGTAKDLYLPDVNNTMQNIFISDEYGYQQPLPSYLWKVVQDPLSKSSLAIIQVNVPDVLPSERSKYMLCRDICGRTEWMSGREWHDVTRGYTYCCSLQEFERAFGFAGVFERNCNGILSDTSLIPDHSLTK